MCLSASGLGAITHPFTSIAPKYAGWPGLVVRRWLARKMTGRYAGQAGDAKPAEERLVAVVGLIPNPGNSTGWKPVPREACDGP